MSIYKQKIIEVIQEKEQIHRKKYKEFCEKNPGYIMNGHLIKADTCQEIIKLISQLKRKP